ncbi:FGGY-family carbohydrate kinase [Benzoatithermus flavus]|uniref:FGGY-family carbohydrate kinase n=1 Tax=Benzoatithermus flavus TaxID=3108223 RepID=A0ABU8XLP7_9PROT
MNEPLVIGVDVGTGSARAGVFDTAGRCRGRSQHPIRLRRPRPEHAEHSSEDIWQAVCRSVREAVAEVGVEPEAIRGIGFDATCSLVVRDEAGRPLSVSTDGASEWDTIVWLDHRAVAEAEACTASRHRVLDHVGGTMSPEMETPKLMWLKRHLPETWARAGLFLDLADYLTWRASGSVARSECTLTCKWTYLAHETPAWQQDFFAAMGIPDMRDRGRLPDRATPIGSDLGPLTPQAAQDLGLSTACRVAMGLIDAHAGALGVLGAAAAEGPAALDRQIAMIAGTSTCHMALSAEARPVRGVWGPYFGAVLPGLWLNEGGQSASGALLDHIVALHAAARDLEGNPHAAITARIDELRAREGEDFAKGLHVLPDFHGNRSPLADPHATGVVSGLTLDHSFDSLCRLYYRTAVAVALGTRHILDALNEKGWRIDTLHVAGGHTRNPLLMELYADATGCAVVTPAEDAVLLGSAMTAAVAAGLHPSLPAAAVAMSRTDEIRSPDPARRAGFDRDYRIFLLMHEQRRAIDRIVRGAA